MNDTQVPGSGQALPPQQPKESNTGLIVVLILILVVGIGSGTWWVLHGEQETTEPGTTGAVLSTPTQPVPGQDSSESHDPSAPVQDTSIPQRTATPAQDASDPWASPTPVPMPGSRQPVPGMPMRFGEFEVKDAGSGDSLVTYWTTRKDKFFIIGYMQGGSVESQTKDLKDPRVFGRITCGTGAFGGYECFTQVHGGVGRTTMGPDGTLDELAEISRTFYEAWR